MATIEAIKKIHFTKHDDKQLLTVNRLISGGIWLKGNRLTEQTKRDNQTLVASCKCKLLRNTENRFYIVYHSATLTVCQDRDSDGHSSNVCFKRHLSPVCKLNSIVTNFPFIKFAVIKQYICRITMKTD